MHIFLLSLSKSPKSQPTENSPISGLTAIRRRFPLAGKQFSFSDYHGAGGRRFFRHRSSTPAAAVHPSSETFADKDVDDAIVSWFRCEFAAANAIIDALCGHLARSDGGGGRRGDYESVFAAIHRRRMNWIPILQRQKYFSIADVTLELQKATEKKKNIEEIDVSRRNSVVKLEKELEILEAEGIDGDGNGGPEVVEDDSPTSEITDSGLEEVQTLVETVKICSNQEDLEAWRAQIKITKGFVAKEFVKGHMVNVVRGLKLYENILSDTELTRLIDYVRKLRVAGKNGELSGGSHVRRLSCTTTIEDDQERGYSVWNSDIWTDKRRSYSSMVPPLVQTSNFFPWLSTRSIGHIEPIPAPLEGVINHLIKYHLITENRRPNSCIINFFDEGEFSQPFLKPPHLDQPISALFLSESTMAFGRTLVCDKDGNYRGPLMLSLKEGSLLVMRGNSADMARNVMCQSPVKRINITFFRVQIDSNKNPSLTTGDAMTIWQPGVPPPNGTSRNSYDSMNMVPKWGAPQLLMLGPVRPMVMNPIPRRLPRGGTGVFLPWNVGSRKPAKRVPPRAQRARILALPPAAAEPRKVGSTTG
ncbi:hypothetical protein OSB04_022945 [Centaurea solstitialis]|uniref:Uncharacterized protein n=1 Tax=Centaurea solstitialis TaxID=347529 RepID=A0AA38SIY1_9ASTR|nr:hypothetical protein OSB04_022945 [Centaurea solstitialis]